MAHDGFSHHRHNIPSARAKDEEVHHDKSNERGCHRRRFDGRKTVRGPQQPVNGEGLTPDLGRDPACQHRDKARGPHQQRQTVQQRRIVEPPPQPRQRGPKAQPQHRKAKRDHDAEGPEDNGHRWLIRVRDRIQPVQGRIQVVFEDQRRQLGDLNGIVDALFLGVRDAEQDQRRTVRVAIVMPLHCHDLCRLMLKRIQTMHVARKNLQRCHQQKHPHRHREHGPRRCIRAVAQQVQPADRAHDQRRGQIGRQHHMHQTVGEGGVKDDRPPILGHELTDVIDAKARRRLHPTVDRQDPCGRGQRAQCHECCGEHMQPIADPLTAKEHDAKETGFKKEGRKHLIGHERPDDRPCLIRKHRPVCADLVGHDDARDDPHAKGHGKDLLPVVKELQIGLFSFPKPERVEHGQKTCQPD